MKTKVYNTAFQTIREEYAALGKELRDASINFIKEALSDFDIESIELDTEKEGECISIPFYNNRYDSSEWSIVSYVSMNKNGRVVVGSMDLNSETTLDDLSDAAVSDIADAIYNHLENNDLI
jgi:hypothetical protein